MEVNEVIAVCDRSKLTKLTTIVLPQIHRLNLLSSEALTSITSITSSEAITSKKSFPKRVFTCCLNEQRSLLEESLSLALMNAVHCLNELNLSAGRVHILSI